MPSKLSPAAGGEDEHRHGEDERNGKEGTNRSVPSRLGERLERGLENCSQHLFEHRGALQSRTAKERMTISGGSRDAPGDIVPEEPIIATRNRPEHWLVLWRTGRPSNTIEPL